MGVVCAFPLLVFLCFAFQARSTEERARRAASSGNVRDETGEKRGLLRGGYFSVPERALPRAVRRYFWILL